MKNTGLLATRRSLVDRLADWDDRKHWQEFFDSYWKLIYSAARKSGLTDAEAQEVVQETVITVAKNIDKLQYNPAIGSFKGWLLRITRWRIADQFRKREPAEIKRSRSTDDGSTATIERVPDSRAVDLEAVWERNGKRTCSMRRLPASKRKSIQNSFRFSTATCAKNGRRRKLQSNFM
jgi:RNA polymerase sigma-70 factor (ECF subfamily)